MVIQCQPPVIFVKDIARKYGTMHGDANRNGAAN